LIDCQYKTDKNQITSLHIAIVTNKNNFNCNSILNSQCFPPIDPKY